MSSLENIVERIDEIRNEIDSKFEIEDVIINLENCKITKNVLDYISFGMKDKTINEIEDYMKNYKEHIIVTYEILYLNDIFYLPKTFVGLLLNKIHNKTNNILYKFIPRKINENEMVYMVNSKLDKYLKLRKFLKSAKFEDVINVYLQVLLCFSVIDRYYELNAIELHKNIYIDKLNKNRILTYKVLLNGKLVKINLKTNTFVRIVIPESLGYISFEQNNIRYMTFPRELISGILDFSEVTMRLFTAYVYIKLGRSNKTLKNIINRMKDKYNFDEILNYVLYKSGINEYLDFSNLEIPKYKKCKIFEDLELLMMEELLFESGLTKPKYFRE